MRAGMRLFRTAAAVGLLALAPGMATMAAVAQAPRNSFDPGAVAPTSGVLGHSLTVMSYNVEGLPVPARFDRAASLDRIAGHLADLRKQGRQPNVVMLQEAFAGPAKRIADEAGYRYVAAGPLASGHWSDYHRVFCRAPWSCWRLGEVLAAMVLELVPAGAPVVVTVDDTTPQHRGEHVYGKGKHHDACRSTHSHVVWVWGRKWVVLAVNVKFPFASRPWALRCRSCARCTGRRT